MGRLILVQLFCVNYRTGEVTKNMGVSMGFAGSQHRDCLLKSAAFAVETGAYIPYRC